MIILNQSNIDSVTLRETIRDIFGSDDNKNINELVDTLYVDYMSNRAASYFIATTKNTLAIYSKLPRRNGVTSLHQITLTEDRELIIISLTKKR